MKFFPLKQNNNNSLLEFAEALDGMDEPLPINVCYGYLSSFNFQFLLNAACMQYRLGENLGDIFEEEAKDILVYLVLIANELRVDYYE